MKVDISAKGKLTVRAETEIESYALNRWADDYFGKPVEPGNPKALLIISVTVLEKGK